MLKRLIALVALLALVACGGEDRAELSEPVLLETPAKGHVRRIQRVRLEMNMTGAHGFELKTETTLRYEEIASAVPTALWFLSVSAPTNPPISLGDGRQILFTADTAPGIYRGAPGTYELGDKTAGSVLGVPANVESAAYVTVTTLTPVLESHSYDLRGAKYEVPCTLTVSAGLLTGSVDCPKLADAEGDTVALTWRWTMI